MDFPIAEYMDEDACYAKLLAVLHPNGLACPRCNARDELKVHRRHRAPILDYRCEACGRVFNAFTGTAFHKTHRRPSEILLILRGIAQGASTARMARLVYGAADPRAGAVGSLWDVLRDRRLDQQTEVIAGVLEDECARLLREFFAGRRPLGG